MFNVGQGAAVDIRVFNVVHGWALSALVIDCGLGACHSDKSLTGRECETEMKLALRRLMANGGSASRCDTDQFSGSIVFDIILREISKTKRIL
jgi:hypothetical protein